MKFTEKELKANVLKAKRLGTENKKISMGVLTKKFSSREQVDNLLRKEGFEKEYIKSDCENDFTRNKKSGFYYSKSGVCAYEMSGIVLIALFWDEIKNKLIADNSEIIYKNTSDDSDMARENDGR